MPVNTFGYEQISGHDSLKVDLIDLTLGKDGLGYYLTPKYQIEDERNVREVYIPKVHLPIDLHGINFDYNPYSRQYLCWFGLGKLSCYADDKGYMYYEKIIEEKTKEMTLEEIEKKLGYKVKIVSKR